MTSVVIAAHNEEAVIGRCLDSILAQAFPGEFEIIVVANGCVDRTVEVAGERSGVHVIEIGVASKPAALNAGDTMASGFPRIYLDADISVDAAGIRLLRSALEPPPAESTAVAPPAPLVAVPRRELDVRGRPLLVRGYYAIHSRLPAFQHGLFGRGLIATSELGRSKFTTFPDMIADDLFLDSIYSDCEKVQIDSVATVVAAPFHTADLIRRLVRVRRGNAAMRAAGRAGRVAADVRPADRWAWLRTVVLPRPWLLPASVAYVGITVVAAAKARRSTATNAWGRDASTRTAAPDTRGNPNV